MKPNVRDVRPLVQHLLMLPSAVQRIRLEVKRASLRPPAKSTSLLTFLLVTGVIADHAAVHGRMGCNHFRISPSTTL
jgi:hypothetical protein